MSTRPKAKASVVLPMINVGGVQYVKREHFEIARHAAENNLQIVKEMQRDRDQWRNKFIALETRRGKR